CSATAVTSGRMWRLAPPEGSSSESCQSTHGRPRAWQGGRVATRVQAMAKPTLWQIEISHFSEKVRWALAHKGVEHERRAPTPGAHMVVALWLTRGRHKTFPVLQLDGRTIGDSTAIIAALERRYPD